jgi:hypothetical protein
MLDINGTNTPWMVAHIIGIYHANILTPCTSKSQRVEFLHVHWFDQDILHAAGPYNCRLEHIQLRSPSALDAFGFIDPSAIIRSTHLILAFDQGHMDIAADFLCTGNDWKYYYINR